MVFSVKPTCSNRRRHRRKGTERSEKEYLRYDQDLIRITRHFFMANKPVAVVCHGVEIVAAAGVLSGRNMTTVGKCALDITQVGGTYADRPCVVDGNMVSARTWHDNTELFREFMKMLKASKAG